MQAIQAECCYLHQGAHHCVVIGDHEEPTPEEIVNFAQRHEAITVTGLYLVSFPNSEPGQSLLSQAQLVSLFQ